MYYSEEEKAKNLADWRRSNKSSWAYAKEKGINPQTFVNWTKKEKQLTACFVEVPVKIKSQSYIPELIIEKGDFKIHVPLSIGSAGLRTVMEGLGAVL